MKKFLATILSIILILTIIPMAYAEESNTYKVGDIVQFGSYPQSEVKDEALIAELNALAPEWDEWTSYGYYSGNGEFGSMIQGNWMRYTDLTLNGSKYRGVKFTQYRPIYTINASSKSSYQDDNCYTINNVYWFKYEPIDWRVLNPKTGLVMCEKIIDSQAYSNAIYCTGDGTDNEIYSYFNDSLCLNYASDYETSSIRKWLNIDYYNLAFTNYEKNEIAVSYLNNDCYESIVGGSADYEVFNSNATNDKVFLLSYDEVINENYGFSSEPLNFDGARSAKGSDYAKIQGLFVYDNPDDFSNNGTSCWLLRSPGFSSHSCSVVSIGGHTSRFMYVYIADYGIRPALKLKDISKFSQHNHSYDLTMIAPTCTEKGYTTYTCACGDSYIADYVNALGHKDNNGDYKCDNGCGYEFEKPAPEKPDTPEEPSKDCSCNCHKGGISGFFWKIINFFNKLFKSKQYCSCGAKHW